MNCTTLHDELDRIADISPNCPIRFSRHTKDFTLEELSAESRELTGGLAACGVLSDMRVGLLLPEAPQFLRAFFAAGRLGACLCPLPVPLTARDDYAARLTGILTTGDIRLVLTTARGAHRCAELPDFPSNCRCIVLDELPERPRAPRIEVSPDSDAIVQFTSGSTSRPKGVRLSHRAVSAGIIAIRDGIEVDPGHDRVAGWLPLFHDMGLIGALTAILSGLDLKLWNPGEFIRDAAGWLGQLAEGGYTITTMPNFAYDHLIQSVSGKAVRSMDLSRIRIAFNGSEMVSPRSVERFLAHFAPAGFPESAMFPVYGLAEATLAVSFPPLGSRPTTDWVDREQLRRNGKAHPVEPHDPCGRGVVAVGRPVAGMEVRIAADGNEPFRASGVSSSGTPCEGEGDHGINSELFRYPERLTILGDRNVGEIHIRGPAVTSGYVGTEHQPFTVDGWLPTGDLGYFHAGQLFVTGRRKEMLILRGENFYPEDIESVVRDDPAVYRGRCVAFVEENSEDNEDVSSITVLIETAVDDGAEQHIVARRIRRRTSTATGLNSLRIGFVPPNGIPRTTSGKLCRLSRGKNDERVVSYDK